MKETKIPIHVTVDPDQFFYLKKLVDARRSTFSQVVRELLGDIIKKENYNGKRNVSLTNEKSDVGE